MLTSPQFHRKVRLPLAVHNIPLETSQVPWLTHNYKDHKIMYYYFTCLTNHILNKNKPRTNHLRNITFPVPFCIYFDSTHYENRTL